MESLEALGLGLYTIADAARLLRTPRQTVARWLNGYVRELRHETKFYPPILHRSAIANSLTFGDLVEMMYIREFRRINIDLKEIRLTAEKFRIEWNTPYPLATERFLTDGKRLLLEHPSGWQHASTGQIQASFEEISRHLVHLGDFSCEWMPLGINRQVVLSPNRSFGKPIDNRSGAHTYVLARAIADGNSVDKVAWWYETSPQAVKDSVEFEQTFCNI